MESSDIKMFPVRDIYKISRYEGLGDILKKDNSIRGRKPENPKEGSMIDEEKYLFDPDTVQVIKYFARSSAEEKPRYHFFLHAKMDGVLSAYQLKEMLGTPSIMLDRAFLGESSISCIKQRKLLGVGLQQEIIQKKQFLSTDRLAQLIAWGVSTLFTFVSLLIVVLTATVDDQPITINPSFPRLLPIMASILFGILTLFLATSRRRECHTEMIKELKTAVKKMSDAEFFDFVSNFEAEDYAIPGLQNSPEEMDIVCPLSVYSSREQAVLLQYWKTNTHREYWWIFLEQNPRGDPFVLAKSNKYHRRIYRLLPLTFVEKRKLATQIGRDIHDPGLKQFGVDYVANKFLHNCLLSESETDEALHLRLDQFVKQYQNQYPFNIPRVIRLVAELSVTFRVDYSISPLWESIFTFSSKDPLTLLDRKLSTDLVNRPNSDNVKTLNHLSYLVSQILSVFDMNLYQVIKSDYGPRQMTKDIQLCLVKAIRCKGKREDDQCLAIAECLYNQMQIAVGNPEAFYSDEWFILIEEALRLFKSQGFGWFTASLIHLLLELWEKKPSEGLRKLLCKKIVQDSSKEQIFFYNQERQFDEATNLDVIKDHARLLSIFVPDVSEDKKQSFVAPEWTNMLNLTDDQRKLYAFALMSCRENLIPQYFQVIFEMYIIQACQHKPVFCRHLFPSIDLQFQDSVRQLLELVIKLGEGRKCQAIEGCEVLSQIISEPENSKELTGKCLYYMTLWEALGFSVGSFAASVIFHEAELNVWDNDKGKRLEEQEIRIDMGNTVARLVYLTCMQTREGGFFIEQAIELTSSLTAYQNPSLPILGYILCLSMYSFPEHCKKRLQDFFLAKKSVCDLRPTKGQVVSNDLIQYIADVIACSILNEDTKKDYFRVILNDYAVYYGGRGDSPIIKEFLCRYVDKQPTDQYENSTPQELLTEAIRLCSSHEIIYLLYAELDKVDDSEEVAKLCPLVAEHLIHTVLGYGVLLLIKKWIVAIKKAPDSGEYFFVAQKLNDYITYETVLHTRGIKKSLMNEARIDHFFRFFEELDSMVRARQKPYFNFFDVSKIEQNKVLLSELEQRVMAVTLLDVVHSKRWTSLPLLTCICYILEHAKTRRAINKNYAALDTQADREEWLLSNVYNLYPIVNQLEGTAISQEFVDLLNLTIRKKDWEITSQVQSIVEMHITSIVNATFDKEERREQIVGLMEIVRNSYSSVEL